MHFVTPVKGTVSGNLIGDLNAPDVKLKEAQALFESIGLEFEYSFGKPAIEGLGFNNANLIPEDAPSPPLDGITEIEDEIHKLRGARQRSSLKVARFWVQTHLGYFRRLEPELQEAVMLYLAPLEGQPPTLKSAAAELQITEARLRKLLRQALKETEDWLKQLRQEYIDGIDREKVRGEPVAVLDLEPSQRLKLRKSRLLTVDDVASKTPGDIARCSGLEGVTRDRYIRDIRKALDYWGLDLAGGI